MRSSRDERVATPPAILQQHSDDEPTVQQKKRQNASVALVRQSPQGMLCTNHYFLVALLHNLSLQLGGTGSAGSATPLLGLLPLHRTGPPRPRSRPLRSQAVIPVLVQRFLRRARWIIMPCRIGFYVESSQPGKQNHPAREFVRTRGKTRPCLPLAFAPTVLRIGPSASSRPTARRTCVQPKSAGRGLESSIRAG